MFVDASAMVAILTREPEADAFSDVLEGARSPITSPVAVFEAVLGVRRKRQATLAEAIAGVMEFLHLAAIATLPITVADAAKALEAFSRYGKGQGHPAQLNLGDCFAYAVASNNQASMLFKGDDFSRTDIPAAVRLED